MSHREKKTKRKTEQSDSRTELVQKQKLKDLEHLISMDTGTYLVLIEEGTAQQIDLSKQTARNTLLKHGADMMKLAQELGEPLTSAVEDFLNSIDEIVHCATGWIDPAQIKQCHLATIKLQKALHK